MNGRALEGANEKGHGEAEGFMTKKYLVCDAGRKKRRD